ncbi:S-adenosyl-L-methionine-dependent methyltransferase [Hyaloscypha hepaticicola]|uniref:S-adenosyl-L-methionine-dependent methyltransferase n=1 Tax=Hyaloscypha hepaticicola TaxID=2082293 RepID=A0A2J6Q8S8_9HELO|nr:S-adenosyl-L-methionine-dependent methyltransferase [Hyaloscypha hepaticicola]
MPGAGGTPGFFVTSSGPVVFVLFLLKPWGSRFMYKNTLQNEAIWHARLTFSFAISQTPSQLLLQRFSLPLLLSTRLLPGCLDITPDLSGIPQLNEPIQKLREKMELTQRENIKFLLPLVASVIQIIFTMCKMGLFIYLRGKKKPFSKVETSIGFSLLVLGILLLVFSVIQDERAIVEVLSLNNGALIVYQCAWSWKFVSRDNEDSKLGGSLFLVICVVIVSVLSGNVLLKGREILHYLAFSIWGLMYILLFVVYYRLQQRMERDTFVRNLVKGNMWFSGISFVCTVLAVGLLAIGKLDFASSLLVKLMAGLWFLLWLYAQVRPILKDKCKSDNPKDPSFPTRVSHFQMMDLPLSAMSDLEEARHDVPAEPPPVHTRYGFRRDSVIGDPDGTSTTSILSEYGRFITENRPSYLEFGKDEHELWKTTLSGRLHAATLKSVSNVLDIGTGQGHWAIDFANQYVIARVIGFDSSFAQVDELYPLNFEYQLGDVELGWTFAPNRFDYIHGRMLSHWIKNRGNLCREALRCLQPRGIFEIQDFESTSHSEDDTRSWSDHLKEAGFINIQVLYISTTAFTKWANTHGEVELNVWKDIRDFKTRSVVIYGSKPS